MRIVHVCDYGSLGRQNGITSVVSNLVSSQRNLGHSVYFLNVRNNGKTQENQYDKVAESISKFKKIVDEIHPDIVIFHSAYILKNVFFAFYLRLKRIPYLVQPHGEGTNYAQHQKYFKKKIANILLFNHFIRSSKGIVFLSELERNLSFVFGRLTKNYIIPNGCTLPSSVNNSFSIPYDRLHFIYIGRIDIYIKGLDVLVKAIGNIYDKISDKVVFDFYGYKYDDAFDKLIAPYADLIHYHGPVYNEEKDKAFRTANIFILTSRSEGMPMGVLEALSYGKPCLITTQTNMANFVGNKAGWVVDCNVEAISQAILTISKTSTDDLYQMSENAKKAVQEYSWEKIALRSIDVYRNVLNS